MSKLTNEEKRIKIQALEDELKIMRSNSSNDDKVEDEGLKDDEEKEESETIQKPPKKKKQLTDKQIAVLKKGNELLRQKRELLKKEKAEKERLQQELLEKRLIDKAIKLKKKQIKQNKILFESESESEEEQPTRIQKIKPVAKQHPPPETPKSKLRFI